MESWAWLLTDPLWQSALTVVPLVLVVAGICHWVPLLPATRHTLWLLVLLWLIASPFVPAASMPGLVATLTTREAATSSEPPALAATQPQAPSAAPGPSISIHPAAAPGMALARSVPWPTERVPSSDVAAAPEFVANSTTTLSRPVVRLPEAIPVIVLEARTAEPSRDASGTGASTSVTARIERPAPPVERPTPYDRPSTTPAAAAAIESDVEPDNSRTQESSDDVSASAPVADTASDQSAGWRPWLAGLIAVRDAIARLPSMPASIWLGGMALLVCLHGYRLIRHRPALRSASPAPAHVRTMVVEVGRSLGMCGVPETVMTRSAISPMIACGRRPRLVLPTPLWSQLDDASRRAVLCHELAHVRRRDHWVRWGQLLICALYWWHPVAWWVRHRLSEEAELCCDAWVTWLMPHQRRAYAEALLRTKQYVSAHEPSVPAVGIGVTTRRARRFARRLKMVMTANTRPGMSLAGIVLALGLALFGWLTAPVWACPPETKADQPGQTAPVAAAAAAAAHAPTAAVIATGESDDQADEAEDTFGQHMAHKKQATKAKTPKAPKPAQPFVFSFSGGKGAGAAPPTPHDAPAATGRPGRDNLEQRLERLERQLERLSERMEQMSAGPVQPGQRRAPRAGGGGGRSLPELPHGDSDDGQDITRVYKLPPGKLEALIEFMRRDDVPVRISPAPVDGGIQVHGTARQHEIFQSFINLIHPSENRGADLGPETTPLGLSARLGDLARLKALEALKLGQDDSARTLLERLTRERSANADELEARKLQLHAQQNALRAQAENLRQQAEHMRQEAERMRESAQELFRKAQEMRERSDATQNERESRAGQREAQAIEKEAERIEQHADQIEANSDSMDERAVAFESQADDLAASINSTEPK